MPGDMEGCHQGACPGAAGGCESQVGYSSQVLTEQSPAACTVQNVPGPVISLCGHCSQVGQAVCPVTGHPLTNAHVPALDTLLFIASVFAQVKKTQEGKSGLA